MTNDPQPFATLPRGLAPFGYRDFSLYWTGVASTTTGRWVELTGLVWLVYELTGSPLLVGLLGAARALPNLLLSPIAGVICDRADQRQVLFWTQAAGLLASLSLGLLVMTEVIEIWQVYLQVLVQAMITCLDSSARQSLFPRLVPRVVMREAVTLSIAATRVSKFVGPAVGGIAIAGLGESAPFFINAVSFFGLMGALAWMRGAVGRPFGASKLSFRGELIEGLRYMRGAPVLSGILKIEIVFGLFEVNPTMIAILGRELLDTGPRALGFLLSAPALGSFIGIGWLLIAKAMSRQGRFSLCSTLLYAATVGLLAFSWSYAASFVLLAAIGMLEALVTITRNSIMQLAAPENMRGRIMANMGMVTRGVSPFAETQSGVLVAAVGPHFALLASAMAVGTAAGVAACFNRDLWQS